MRPAQHMINMDM